MIRFGGQKVKVTIRPTVVKIPLLGSFCHHRRLNYDSLNSFECIISGSAILARVRLKRSKFKVKYCQER